MSQGPRTYERLIFGGVELIPTDDQTIYCSTTDRTWYLPGGEIADTNELVRRASQRGIRVQLATIKGIARTLETLTEEEIENE